MRHYNDLGYGGNDRWYVEVSVWPHSTRAGPAIEQSMAGPRVQKMVVKANSIDEALALGRIFVAGVLSNPIVWQCRICCIRQAREDEDHSPEDPCVTTLLWKEVK